MGLMDDIGAGPVALDTAVFIYFIEEHPRYLPIIEPLFDAVADGRLTVITSEVTLLEVLVIPFRNKDNSLASVYESLLTRSRGLQMAPLSRALLRSAARLRAVTRMKTPDALQLATALSHTCTSLVTNDRRFPSVSNLPIIQLNTYQ